MNIHVMLMNKAHHAWNYRAWQHGGKSSFVPHYFMGTRKKDYYGG